MLAGTEVRNETFATVLFEGINFKCDFLKQKVTCELFPKEQYLPSVVIDRDSMRGYQEASSLDTFALASARTSELLASYQRPPIAPKQEHALRAMVASLARAAGMEKILDLV